MRQFCLCALLVPTAVLAGGNFVLEAPKELKVLSRQLRVDLVWHSSKPSIRYEVERADQPEGPFEKVPNDFPELNVFSGYLGRGGVEQFYRVRSVQAGESQ